MTSAVVDRPRRGLIGTLKDIYHERQRFDFIGRSRLWLGCSGLAVAVSILALAYSGLNLGIDFEGGTQWEARVARGGVVTDDVREALADTAAANGKLLVLGNDGVRVQSEEVTPAQQAAVAAALAEYADIDASSVSVVNVGPTWGDQVSRKALTALIFFFVLIGAYLTFRFEWKMALSAIVAVLHDIVITVGVYAITSFEVTPGTVVAFLTILGFSLYDTVVVFDKIDENTPGLGTEKGDTYSAMVNRSMNQVLMRSLNTTFVALLPVASLLVVGSGILGAVTLRDFALALFVGLLVGAYSSIFVATPILAWIKEREPRNQALRERSAAQLARTGSTATTMTTGAAAIAVEHSDTESRATEPSAPSAPAEAAGEPPPAPGPVVPRPRQQRRRKRR